MKILKNEKYPILYVCVCVCAEWLRVRACVYIYICIYICIYLSNLVS